MFTVPAVGLKISIASVNPPEELLSTSLMTTGVCNQLLSAGEAVPAKDASAAAPSGKRPCDTSFVCVSKVMMSSVVVPAAEVSTMLSPPPLSLKLA